jgi:hypothetical protein
MIAFASPPRRPNPWFVVDAVIQVEQPTPGRSWLRRALLPLGITGVFASAIAVLAQLPERVTLGADAFATTGYPAEAERLLRSTVGPAPTMSVIRGLMSVSKVTCRDAIGNGADSLLVCLAPPVRFGGVYSRMSFRFVSRGARVTSMIACPAMVTTRQHDIRPARLARARPTLRDPSCWRDQRNPADAEWAYAALPSTLPFTLVITPDAPRLSRETAPSRDTLTVIW